MNLPNYRKIRIFLAVLFLLFGTVVFVYARSVLNKDNVEVQEKQEDDKRVNQVKPAKATLIVKTSHGNRTYERNMQNTDSVFDLLREVMKSEDFTFEKVAYTYGTEIDSVNNQTAPQGYDWKVFMSAEQGEIESTMRALVLSSEEIELLEQVSKTPRVDITYSISRTPLVDKAVFELELAPSIETRQINLYYYKSTVEDECSPENIQPVSRQIEATESEADNKEMLLERAITLLINNDLTQQERSQGFSTEFPNENFRLLNIEINNNKAVLTFTEVPGFTTGGACRVGLLREQILKTARQFYSEIELNPEELFQP